MNHLLINGCSYAHTWKNYKDLADRLQAKTVINFGQCGSSNDRILRTTFEYILNNPQTDFVIIMLTFETRAEAAWAVNLGDEEGSWVSYSVSGIQPNRPLATEYNKIETALKKYIDDKAVYDSHPAHIEKLLIDIILLTTWLRSLKINYCIFNTCEHIIKTTIELNSFDMKKMDIIRKDKRIIDIENFMSNKWMYVNGAQLSKDERAINVNPEWGHYGNDGYTMLNDFLYNYINENCL